MVSFFLSHVPEKVYFQCILKHLINPQERQPLMFSYSTSFDIHWLICGDIFQPNSWFCVSKQFMQNQTNTCKKHMSEQKNTCENKEHMWEEQTNTCDNKKTNKHMWEQKYIMIDLRWQSWYAWCNYSNNLCLKTYEKLW